MQYGYTNVAAHLTKVKPKLKYIELKSGFGDNEPNWIEIEILKF